MHIEITVLIGAALVHSLLFLLFSISANIQVGPKRTLGPRDEPIDLSGKVARVQRALNNSFESLILFGIAIFVLVAQGKESNLSAIVAHVFLAARILYIPSYIYGLVPWRSVIWIVGWISTVILLVLALL